MSLSPFLARSAFAELEQFVRGRDEVPVAFTMIDRGKAGAYLLHAVRMPGAR